MAARRTGAALAITALVAAGCETHRTTVRSTLVPARSPAPVAAPPSEEPYAGVRAMGSVPFDGRTLPLVSPRGAFVATQVGAAPAWETLTAGAGSPGAPGPAAYAIEIYRCDPGAAVALLQARSEYGLLLGRSADAGGLLVEAPQPDGSRWIGRMDWLGGPTHWLVTGGEVNAFACLRAPDRLAWSRRPREAPHFDLVVRRGDGEWTLDAGGGDWLLPSWSEAADGLFALRLDGGRLDLVFMNARSAEDARQSMMRLPLAQGMTARDAYLCLSSRASIQGVPPAGFVHQLFWHPDAARMALWRPLDSAGAPDLLAPGSVAAEIDPSGFILVTTADRLILQDLLRGAERTLLPGPLVPRPTAEARWPYVLLLPQHGEIGLLALRIEPGQ